MTHSLSRGREGGGGEGERKGGVGGGERERGKEGESEGRREREEGRREEGRREEGRREGGGGREERLHWSHMARQQCWDVLHVFWRTSWSRVGGHSLIE